MKNPKPSVGVISWKCQGGLQMVGITGLEAAFGEKRLWYFHLLSSVHFLSGKASEYCDSAQRWHIAIAIVFSMRGKCWWGTVPTFLFFYSAVTCLWRKLNFQKVWVFVLFATDEDKPLQTLYSEALTAWFNLNPILLILIVAPLCSGKASLQSTGKWENEFQLQLFQTFPRVPWAYLFQIQRQNN